MHEEKSENYDYKRWFYIVSGSWAIDKQIIGMGKENEPDKWIKGEKMPSVSSVLCAAL